jgi:hypothetical protein
MLLKRLKFGAQINLDIGHFAYASPKLSLNPWLIAGEVWIPGQWIGLRHVFEMLKHTPVSA